MHPFEKNISALRKFIEKSVFGKAETIELALTALMGEGHLLIEDVPGVGKTTLAVALAQSIQGDFHRIQFTSDLLPSDVLGVSIFNTQTKSFEFKPGPIFANIVLADEINRTTPKTQSALLECMQDRKISVERESHYLPRPFMVLATQNPIEFHGTYPLPESQLDRFMMRIQMGYPSIEEESRILGKNFHDIEKTPEAACSKEDIVAMQKASTEVKVDEAISKYILEIVRKTRESKEIDLGVSPRGTISLYRAVQARAFVQGRMFAIPEDVKLLAVPVLAHRLIVSGKKVSATSSDQRSSAQFLIERILETIEVPV